MRFNRVQLDAKLKISVNDGSRQNISDMISSGSNERHVSPAFPAARTGSDLILAMCWGQLCRANFLFQSTLRAKKTLERLDQRLGEYIEC